MRYPARCHFPLYPLAWNLASHFPEMRDERVRGIEPPYAAWEATVLPLNYTRDEEVESL